MVMIQLRVDLSLYTSKYLLGGMLSLHILTSEVELSRRYIG